MFGQVFDANLQCKIRNLFIYKEDNLNKRPLLIEIVGLAGSGKTTLTRVLTQFNSNLQVGLQISKIKVYPHLVNPSLFLLPVFFLRFREDRWFDWKETKAIMFLNAWYRELKRPLPKNKDAIIFDHGPIFWLTRIREFGPELSKSRAFEKWWTNELSRWLGMLDIVIWLDAPDEILLRRIQTREQDHIVKAESVQNIYEFLTRFRSAFNESTTIAKSKKEILYYTFNTNLKTPQQIADDMLTIING